VSAVSAHPAVRAALVPRQRQQAEMRGGIVAEGRDIGTVVFPNAHLKLFLVASPEVRALRRAQEDGTPDRYAEILADIQRRDHHDAMRPDSPLTQAPDAIVIDTEGEDAARVVERVMRIVRERIPGAAERTR
jgi:cytidylate kinase